MAEDNLVLEHLRAIRADIGDIKADIRELKEPAVIVENRVAIIERQMGNIFGEYASLSQRFDCMAADIATIRRRVELVET